MQSPTTVAATSTVSTTPIAPVSTVVPTTIPQPATCPVPVFPLIPTNGHLPMAFGPGPGPGLGVGVTFVHPSNDVFVLASRKRKKENPASTYCLNYFSDDIIGQFGGYPWAKKDVCYRGHEGYVFLIIIKVLMTLKLFKNFKHNYHLTLKMFLFNYSLIKR